MTNKEIRLIKSKNSSCLLVGILGYRKLKVAKFSYMQMLKSQKFSISGPLPRYKCRGLGQFSVSKKADIPVTILVLLTIALCIFALIAFSVSSSKIKGEIKSYNILEKYYIQANSQKFAGGKSEVIKGESVVKKWTHPFRKGVLEYQIEYIPYSKRH